MKYLSSLQQKDLSTKVCLLRVDLNIENEELDSYSKNQGKIPFRIEAVLPTIKFLIKKGAKVIIISHRGRPPKVSTYKFQTSGFTLKPFAKIISNKINEPVHFLTFETRAGHILSGRDIEKINNSKPGSVFLLENLRFLEGEETNDRSLARKLSRLGNFYVDDAFAVSHRKDASVVAITELLPSYAGLLLEDEIKNLSLVIRNPRKPLTVILGGAKVSEKIGLIESLYKKADYFLTGGAIANSFFAAEGLPLGNSIYEKSSIISKLFKKYKKKIILPIDPVIHNKKILDIGPLTIRRYGEIINRARTIVWNGPLGLIEDKKFKKGSEAVLKAILRSHAFSVIGGGETTSLLRSAQNYAEDNAELRRNVRVSPRPVRVSPRLFISTGGGAMLKYLAGEKLPGIEALEKSKIKFS